MRHGRFVVPIAGLLLGLLGRAHDADACSCVGPQLALLTPRRSEDAPLNTRVRIEVPPYLPRAGVVLRAHAGPVVPTTRMEISGRSLDVVELVPAAPLAKETRYEIAIVDPQSFPSTTVIGTFKTGSTLDTTPPAVKSFGKASTRMNLGHVGGGMCTIAGPWVTIDGIEVSDPGRPDARLTFAIWGPDENGKLDLKGPPTAIYGVSDGRVVVGQTSLCDPHEFPLRGPRTSLVLAALDEAGNRGPQHLYLVDLTRPSP